MQAVTGFEVAVGGAGNEPLAATWIPIDMSGGWLSAAGILAGLYAREVSGHGQSVVTSLLGAGMLLHSGVFERDGDLVRGPALDSAQTGYGPGYRIYEAADGWFALVIPDEAAWRRISAEVAALPAEYAPLGADVPALAAAFATAPAARWVERLRALGAYAEPIEDLDRDGFRRAVLDDPVNRRLGRVVAYETPDWGHFEQVGPLVKCGPEPAAGPALMLPRIGEHTVEVLDGLGFGRDEIDALLAAKVARR
jgi:crotonobetainyl-CoA:carnitine CoA-transferase CaiB-like acyl-CoA transferase